jgi:hypothetical protein
LQGLVDGLSGTPGWEKVRDAMQTGLNQALQLRALVVAAPSVPGINTGNLRADDVGFSGLNSQPDTSAWQKNISQLGRSEVISGLKELDQAGLQTTADFAAGVQDIELYNAALGEIKARADAAKTALKTLTGDVVQSQLNALSRNKNTTDPKDFLLQQRDLQTTLEIDRFAEIATPTENQSIAHHDKLLQIYADYVAGMEALGVTAFTQANTLAQQTAAANATLASGYAVLNQAKGITVGSNQSLIDSLKQLYFTTGIDSTELTKLIDNLKELDKTTAQQAGLNKFKSDLQGVEQTLSSVFAAFGASSTQQQGISELFNTVNKGMDAVGQFATGDIVGGVESTIGAVLSLGDAIMNLSPAYQAAKKAALELAAAETAAMGSKNYGGKSILNPYYDKLQADAAALTTKANAGFWQQVGWAIFGGAPKTLDKAASETLQLASQTFNDFAGGLYGSLESALMNAFDSGNFDGVAASVEKSLNQLVAKMYLQTLIAKSKIGDDLKQLADDQAGGKSITADLARLKGDTSNVISQFQAGSAGLPGFGAGAASGSTGPGSVIGAGPSAVYGVPEIKFPEVAMAGLTSFTNAMPVFTAGSQRMLDAANLIVRTFGGPVSRSGNSGYV